MSNLATIVDNILADSGIDDINVVVTTGSYADPAWITSLAWTKITGVPSGIVTGTGNTNYLPKFTSNGSTIGNSQIFDNGTNVGIGTNNPTAQMSGTVGLSIVNGSNAALGLSNGTNNWLNYLVGTTYRIWNNTSTEVMVFHLNGNIGIGTSATDSGARLQVASGASRFVQKFTTSSNGMYTAYASSAGDAGYIGNGQGILSTAIESDFAIRSEAALLFAAGGNNEAMRITSVGQLLLGISSTSETTKLLVKQSQDLDYRGISVESAAAGGFFGSMSIDANGNLSFAHSYTGGSGSYRDIRFLTSNVERLRIFSDGNVFIGSSPSNAGFKLDVNGTGRFSGALTGTQSLFNSTSTQLILQNTDGGTNAEKVGMFMTGGDTFKILSLNDNNTTRVDNIIVSNVLSGNVGIGTATPATRLEVASGSSVSTEVQRWSYDEGNPNFSLRLRQEVSSGLVKHVFDLVNNATTYSNNLVLTNGKVGIKQTSPLAPLHVGSESSADDANVQRWDYDGSTAYQLILKQTVTSEVVRWNFSQINNDIAYNNVLVLDRGKVAVGTTSPNYSLTVNGSLQAGYILLGDTANGNNSTIEFVTGPNSTSYIPSGGQGNINYYGPSSLTLCYGGGNVLIGTITDGGYKLDVSGTIRSFSATPLVVSMTSNGANDAIVAARWQGGVGMEMRYFANDAQGFIDNTYQATSGQVFGDIYFRQNLSGTMTSRMMIQARSGCVGIGTVDPSSRMSGTVGLSIVNSANAAIGLSNGSSVNWLNYLSGSTYRIWNNSVSEVMTLTLSGNVLIGTTSDNGNRLRVNGTIFSDSSVTATSFFESSDATIKTLVEDDYQAKGIESVVAKLYIKNGKQELGYYAQDLEGVLPSAVSKGSNGLLNLSYREVHTAKIAFLEKRINELEQQLKNN
jgi:uncharacterized protein YaiE (UPF0345 family)